VPGIARVQRFQGSFLDFGKRRIWVIAWPAQPASLLDGQISNGDPGLAHSPLPQGQIAVSAQIATEHHLTVDSYLSLPTPTGDHRYKIAATTTNFGWSPGAVLMSTSDYTHAWASNVPSALGLVLSPRADANGVKRAVRRLFGSHSGLDVLSARQRQAAIDSSAREGLGQLADIAWLLTGAAVLAMVAALGAAIAQRRLSLAELRAEGAKDSHLRRVLLIEAAIMLGAGCVPGTVAGVYGQVVIDGYLKQVTGFPVAGAAAGARPVLIFAIVIVSVLAIMAIPGWWASRVSPALATQE
jgi:putative ABC transport system permease protein